MRRFLLVIGFIVGLSGILGSTANASNWEGNRTYVKNSLGYMEILLVDDHCLENYHSRPGASGVYRDPCGDNAGTQRNPDGSPLFTYRTSTEFNWDVDSSGARITHARGYTSITDNWNLWTEVSNRAMNLGRTDGGAGIVASSPGPVNSPTSAIATTIWWPTKGCGGSDLAVGGYALHIHVWDKWHLVVPPQTDTWSSDYQYYSSPTYFRVTDVGTACI